MNGFQLGSDVTVNPDCVVTIEVDVVNVVSFPVFVRCSQLKLLLACGVRSVQNIRELGWSNQFRLLYSCSSSSGDK